MYQLEISLGVTFPVSLILLGNGTVAFVKTAPVGIVFDQPEQGIPATFTEDGFEIDGEEFQYNTMIEYKKNEKLLSWLIQQNLQLPQHISF